MRPHTPHLAGQETLVGSWSALAALSPEAVVTTSATVVTAVFPAWAPLNNAVALSSVDGLADVAETADSIFAQAGVSHWALWVASAARTFDAPDTVRSLGRLARDTTTLVMTADLDSSRSTHDAVVATSV